MATQDDYIRTALRVPPELHKRIHSSAKDNNRTFNAEIVSRLEASFVEALPSFSLAAPAVADAYQAALAFEQARFKQAVTDALGPTVREVFEELRQKEATRAMKPPKR